MQEKYRPLHTDALIAFKPDLKYVPERGAVSPIFCEVHAYLYVTCIDFTKTACGIVEICLKDVPVIECLILQVVEEKFWRLANEAGIFSFFFFSPCGNNHFGTLEKCW